MKARDTRCGYITSESSIVCWQCKKNNWTRLCFEYTEFRRLQWTNRRTIFIV